MDSSDIERALSTAIPFKGRLNLNRGGSAGITIHPDIAGRISKNITKRYILMDDDTILIAITNQPPHAQQG